MVGEILINVLQDAILFSSIEGFLYSKCYEKIFNLRKFKCNEILIMILGNAIISQIFPAVMYQIFMILWMFSILVKTERINNNFKNIKFSFLIMLLQLISEFSVVYFYDILFKIDLSVMNEFYLFIYLIPARILQIILIYIGGTCMKGWFGTGTTRK